MVEINEGEREKEKRIKRNEDNPRDLWDNVKCPNIWIIGAPEEEDKKEDHEKILEEIIVEKFPKMGKEISTQVQETQSPKWNKPKAKTSRHKLIKLTKIKHKDQILKAAREKQQITHKGIPLRIAGDLSIEILQARREWQDILKVMKEKNLQITVPSKDLNSNMNQIKSNESKYEIKSNMKEKSKALQTSKSSEDSAPPNQLFNKR